jgi:hypothetical protein
MSTKHSLSLIVNALFLNIHFGYRLNKLIKKYSYGFNLTEEQLMIQQA